MDSSTHLPIIHHQRAATNSGEPKPETIVGQCVTDIAKESSLSSILAKLKLYFQEVYLEKLNKVILFGSQARGEAKKDSDIDILIILNNDFNDHQESKRVSYFVSELCLEYDVVITCFFVSLKTWDLKNNGFYRNIHKEGIVL